MSTRKIINHPNQDQWTPSLKGTFLSVSDHNRLGPPTTQRVKTETNNNVQTRVRTTTSTVETRTTAPPSGGVPNPTPEVDLAPRLRHAVTAVDALGVLVQYLSVNLDAFSNPALKSEIERMRREWMQSKENLAQAEAAYKELQEDLTAQTQKFQEDITELRRTHEDTVHSLEARHEQEVLQLSRSHEEEKSSLQNKLQQEVRSY
ncbi:uncharacterized protein LOC113473923 [Diaphorina citri]|uniref:Uncharacterized protein LOC113473923 n=1 Tax=Diaphorina citri TaxID=121845 RepID=A0A3Q0JLI7_DIACI|nr:uncharacterized protein LOC113473923 [Diaphorina citri]